MIDVVVRAARPGDGADLARGWLDGCRYYAALDPERFQVPDDDGLAEWVEELLRRPRSDDEVWLVAEVDGRVVGNLSAELQAPVDSAARQLLRALGQPRLFVRALGVEAAYQRRGVATRLMEAVERWGRERGAVLVSLDTWAHSEQSVPFYQRLGYRRASIVFEKRLDRPPAAEGVELRTRHTADLRAGERAEVRRLLDEAYGPEFTDEDWEHALGGLHTLVFEQGELVGHVSVVQRRLLHQGRAIRTGYVEALAVRSDRRRRGLAAAAMREAERIIEAAYDLGGLGDGTGIPDFYQRRGWLTWTGPTFVSSPEGQRWTPDEDGWVLVRRTPTSPPLELDAPLGCDWRPGDVW
jgi:aminoglycoside 2'-N-acetyltransferase I